MDFDRYKEHFTGPKYEVKCTKKGQCFTGSKIKAKKDTKYRDLIPPGEHHFVSMCLLPILVEAIEVRAKNGENHNISNIHFVNPDGSKSMGANTHRLHCDITYDNSGIEVKYSETTALKFTRKQVADLKAINEKNITEKPAHDVFKGFIALVNVSKKESEVKIMHISAEDFFGNFFIKIKSSKKSAKRKANKKENYLNIIHATVKNKWEVLSKEKYLGLFDLK